MADEMDEIDLLGVWKIPKDVSEEALMEPEILGVVGSNS